MQRYFIQEVIQKIKQRSDTWNQDLDVMRLIGRHKGPQGTSIRNLLFGDKSTLSKKKKHESETRDDPAMKKGYIDIHLGQQAH
jgi:hypothetical protein